MLIQTGLRFQFFLLKHLYNQEILFWNILQTLKPNHQFFHQVWDNFGTFYTLIRTLRLTPISKNILKPKS